MNVDYVRAWQHWAAHHPVSERPACPGAGALPILSHLHLASHWPSLVIERRQTGKLSDRT